MKSIGFLLLVICMGAFALASDTKTEKIVQPISMFISTSVHQTKLAMQQLPSVTGLLLF